MNTQNNLLPGWVYCLHDYRQMFDLSDADLERSILDFPGGVASFNAEMHKAGRKVISGDSAYALSPMEMQAHAEEVYSEDKAHLLAHLNGLRDESESSVQTILTSWEQSEKEFLADYSIGKQQGRYIFMELPELPLVEHQFNMALCSDLIFHTQAGDIIPPQELITELCRVAEEVRVFPLLNEEGEMSEALGPVMLTLQENNFGVEVREVSYKKIKGGNAMLRIWANECMV